MFTHHPDFPPRKDDDTLAHLNAVSMHAVQMKLMHPESPPYAVGFVYDIVAKQSNALGLKYLHRNGWCWAKILALGAVELYVKKPLSQEQATDALCHRLYYDRRYVHERQQIKPLLQVIKDRSVQRSTIQ